MLSSMSAPLRAGAVLIALFACLAPARVQAQDLTDASYVKWRDYLLGDSRQPAHAAIAWRPSFWEAVIEAQAKDRPILLWTMNGHPLACT